MTPKSTMSTVSTSFTPGPWHAHIGIMEPDYIYTGTKEEERQADAEDDECIACFIQRDPVDNHANSYLISAAPDMYSLMHDLMELIEDVCFCGIVVSDEERDRASKLLERGYEIDKKVEGGE